MNAMKMSLICLSISAPEIPQKETLSNEPALPVGLPTEAAAKAGRQGVPVKTPHSPLEKLNANG
jgi:hypothetical protein